jgi:hypothetical protein
MALLLKSETPSSVLGAIQAIENAADVGYRGLGLFTYPRDLAFWALLSRIILQVEQTILERGYRSQTQNAVMYNLARGGAQALTWVADLGAASPASKSSFLFDGALFASAERTLWTAVGYESFTTTFPLWHKGILGAEVVRPNVVRFSGEDHCSRRVRAYLQGLRPQRDREAPVEIGEALEPVVKEKIGNIAKNASGDRFSFAYGDPTLLYRQLRDRYWELSQRLFRHEDSLVVGTYTLRDLRRFYSALLAVCAVHEHACFLRLQLQGTYPVNSGVMRLRHDRWVDLLTKVSGLEPDTVKDILGDLTFGATKTLDLYVHPFVELSEKPRSLGVVPHFPLKSRPDENILRVCSLLRPALYDVITNAKENQMREELKSRAHPVFRVRGPRTLPGGLPDIDLIVEDVGTSTVLIAELKWLRKTIRSVEHVTQEGSFLRGLGQMKKIREFLEGNPQFLLDRKDLSRELRAYRKVHYLLVPRDYFVWVDPSGGIPVVDFEPLCRGLAKHSSLADAIDELLGFDWLPTEGTDFAINYETFTVSGVSVETEVIYANY